MQSVDNATRSERAIQAGCVRADAASTRARVSFRSISEKDEKAMVVPSCRDSTIRDPPRRVVTVVLDTGLYPITITQKSGPQESGACTGGGVALADSATKIGIGHNHHVRHIPMIRLAARTPASS